jgi:hypothetical protein
MNRKILTTAGAFAACLGVCVPAALAQSVTQKQASYEPLQAISYEFGSKFTTGFFVHHSGNCLVTLMVVEKSPPEVPLPYTAARVRLHLNPGQIAGLDSEEGRSLNFTCGADASALLVDTGERGRLVALQRSSLPPVREAHLP